MDININNVKKKLVYIALSTGLIFTACRSTDESAVPVNKDALEESHYLSRPKILLETPVSTLPYTLAWEGNTAARSYEIQSAQDIQFTEKRLSWTTRNDSYLLEELPEGESFIRIRSHFNGESSRWSEILRIERKGSNIILERLRS